MGRTLIVAGLVLVAAGVLLVVLARFGLPRLPGDIVIRRGSWTFYFPIATSILLSILLSLLFYLFRR